MPQLTKTIALPPIFFDAIDKETKYPVDSSSIHHHRANAITECTTAAAAAAATATSAAVVNNTDIDSSDIAVNCDSFNTIEIKRETDDIDDVSIMPVLTDDMDLLSSCDILTTNNDDKLHAGGIKPTTNFLCHRCRQVFSSRDEFETHYKQAYNETPIYTCQICDKQMKNKRSYQRHFNRHSSSQKFTCTICSKKFAQEKLLKKHESVHTTAKSCLDCKEEFFDLYKFKAHRRTHHTQTKKQQLYQCTDCGKIMKNRSSLSMHSKIHSNDRQYGCMICEQKFVQKINLINHLKVHNTTKTHSCNECGKSFVGQSQLLRHCTQHTNIRSFECEICKKFYKTKRDLKLHLMVHSSQRPHKCGMCSKTFLSTSKLKQHLNIHSGDRPFKCRHCPKDFTNFPNWLKHTRRRHKVDHKTGEKLVVMPKFLDKANKAGKMKATKRSKATDNNNDNAAVSSNTTIQMNDETKVKVEGGIQNSNSGDNRLADLTTISSSSMDQDVLLTQALDKCTMPFVVTKSGSEHSTITVNNRTLPLNTSDDLERAASLLMHQTLDLEDDFEFVNIKSETFDPIVSDITDDFQQQQQQQQQHHQQLDSSKSMSTNSYNLTSDFSNFHYTSSDFMYSYYPQATQCDFAMMPLPPIQTVKRKLKGISSSSSIFPGMTNVL
ncbi:zinc finger protein 211-like [Sitodiplosis mosellana]|uniref:zinc finger protein 211-like n=1 Tax=Sitodiplosis mosellana TaxID=263140 RepID=UPI002443B043|nr:zinc finger protein 211-like [Sitodiplosis mosellana]